MSVEAITWALNLKVERSTAKFVLVAMANCANNDMTCWPSVQYLSDATCQDRKTVLENIKRLKEAGYITDTTIRKGRTGQVIVYQLKNPENGTVKEIKETQKRNSTENGTVPKTDTNSTVFPEEQSRFSAETDPKTGHGTVRNPNEPKEKRQGARGTRLSADFVLLAKHAKAANEINPDWTPDEIREIGAMFKDHWIAASGNKACKTDWDATWRNWCRNEKKMGFTSKGKAGGGNWRATDEATIKKAAEMGMRSLVGESMYSFRERISAAIDNGGTPPIKGISRLPQPIQADGDIPRTVVPDTNAMRAILKAGPNPKGKQP